MGKITREEFNKLSSDEKNAGNFEIIDDSPILSENNPNEKDDNEKPIKNLHPQSSLSLIDFLNQSYSQSLSHRLVNNYQETLRNVGKSLMETLKSIKENLWDDPEYDAQTEANRKKMAAREKGEVQKDIQDSDLNENNNVNNEEKEIDSLPEPKQDQIRQEEVKQEIKKSDNKNNIQPQQNIINKDITPKKTEEIAKNNDQSTKDKQPKKASWRENLASGIAAIATGAAVIGLGITSFAVPVVGAGVATAIGAGLVAGANPFASVELCYYGIKGAVKGILGEEKQVEEGDISKSDIKESETQPEKLKEQQGQIEQKKINAGEVKNQTYWRDKFTRGPLKDIQNQTGSRS